MSNVTPLITRRQLEIAAAYRDRVSAPPADYVRRECDVLPTHYGKDRIYFGDELRVAFLTGGMFGVIVTIGAAFVWSFFL